MSLFMFSRYRYLCIIKYLEYIYNTSYMSVCVHACASTDVCGEHVYKCVLVEDREYLQVSFLRSCLPWFLMQGFLLVSEAH